MNPKISRKTPLTYLALGDSYTIGEAVAQNESFPYQFAAQLKLKGLNVADPKIIAKTGWTTDELQAAIKAEKLTQNFDIVTLLIGVNNQYRDYSKEIYRKEFKELLQTALNFAGGNTDRVFVISIPDWGVTPFGLASGRDVKVIAAEIDAFNAINREETLALSISYTDITPSSRKAATDLSLVASDGLHYSGKMHLQWIFNIPVNL
ncbi:MAG TPA: GDSL-type esterase/lipase family protein [Pedobacter sp.]|nr:GDSL-type esterase/lipase family protein [Pedobacter sp.]